MGKEYVCDECEFESDNLGALGSHKKYIHGKDGRYAKQSLEARIDQLTEEVHSKMPEITKGEIEEIVTRVLSQSTFCKDFPHLCQRVGQLEDQGQKVYDLLSSHPIPNESLLHVWEDCEECRPKYKEMLAKGVFKGKVSVGGAEEKEESFEESFPWAVEQE